MNEIEDIWTKKRKEEYLQAINLLIEKLYEIDEKQFAKKGNRVIRFTEYRLKKPDSIIEKLERKGKNKNLETALESIHDLAGARVICFDIKQVYEVVLEVRKLSDFVVIKEKDYIKKPKNNGYQSYHMILGYKNIKVELQIRTILMDAWASIDTILVYKKANPIPKAIKKDIKQFSELSMKMDDIAQNMLERRKMKKK